MLHLKKLLTVTLFAVSLGMTAPVPSVAQVAKVDQPTVLANWSRLMAPEMLNAAIEGDAGLQIIDIRAEKYVKRGAIPGAVSIPYKQWRGPKERPGQPPTEAELEAMLGKTGVSLDKPIVVYNTSGKTVSTGRTAIVYWILKTAGAENLSILSGGFKGWTAADLPQAEITQNLPTQEVELAYNRDWWADPMDIFAVTTRQKEGAILDARLDSQVRKSVENGKPLMSMPMARFIPTSFFMNVLSPDNLTATSKEQYRADLRSRGIELGDGMLIAICQTGELSALSWFYASEIVGVENVRYYPDALQGWKSDGGTMFGMKVPDVAG